MAKERREFERVDVQVPMRYRRAGQLSGLWHEATLTDLSAGGLRFTTDEPVELGVQLEFELRLSIRQAPFVLRGRVASEQLLSAASTEYGVALVDLSPEERVEVDELVRFLSPGEDPPKHA